MIFLGWALRSASPTGMALSLWVSSLPAQLHPQQSIHSPLSSFYPFPILQVFLVYRVALVFEDSFTAKIYSEAASRGVGGDKKQT